MTVDIVFFIFQFLHIIMMIQIIAIIMITKVINAFCVLHHTSCSQVFKNERGDGSRYYRYRCEATGKSYNSKVQAVAHGFKDKK